jgi:hypothetical protein
VPDDRTKQTDCRIAHRIHPGRRGVPQLKHIELFNGGIVIGVPAAGNDLLSRV